MSLSPILLGTRSSFFGDKSVIFKEGKSPLNWVVGDKPFETSRYLTKIAAQAFIAGRPCFVFTADSTKFKEDIKAYFKNVAGSPKANHSLHIAKLSVDDTQVKQESGSPWMTSLNQQQKIDWLLGFLAYSTKICDFNSMSATPNGLSVYFKEVIQLNFEKVNTITELLTILKNDKAETSIKDFGLDSGMVNKVKPIINMQNHSDFQSEISELIGIAHVLDFSINPLPIEFSGTDTVIIEIKGREGIPSDVISLIIDMTILNLQIRAEQALTSTKQPKSGATAWYNPVVIIDHVSLASSIVKSNWVQVGRRFGLSIWQGTNSSQGLNLVNSNNVVLLDLSLTDDLVYSAICKIGLEF